MIQTYLNQSTTWFAKTGNDSYGKPTYGATGVAIKCRWEDKFQLIRNPQGNEVVSKAVCYCVENVCENDKLVYNTKSYTVLSVTDQPWLGGTISHREVYL